MVNLSELPDHIIALIVIRLPCIEDTVRFGAVCKSWRCLVNNHVKASNKRFGPWLMLAKVDNDDLTSEQGKIRSCYSLSSRKLFNLELPLLLGRRCWGTPHGWLFTIGLDKTIFLFHPFTGAKIFFPSQRRFIRKHCKYGDRQHIYRNFISRPAFSSNPPDSSTVAMVIYGGGFEISFASPGDEKWTHIATECAVDDLLFFKGNFYCIDGRAVLWICNINQPQPTAHPIASAPTGLITGDHNKFYLVEISGHLHLISRISKFSDEGELSPLDGHSNTNGFVSYVFDFGSKQWLDNTAGDLNGHAVLLGNNTTCALSALDYPELRQGCIHFTDDHVCHNKREVGYHYDMGVYDLKNKAMIEPFYQVHEQPSQFFRPFFFFPSLA